MSREASSPKRLFQRVLSLKRGSRLPIKTTLENGIMPERRPSAALLIAETEAPKLSNSTRMVTLSTWRADPCLWGVTQILDWRWRIWRLESTKARWNKWLINKHTRRKRKRSAADEKRKKERLRSLLSKKDEKKSSPSSRRVELCRPNPKTSH